LFPFVCTSESSNTLEKLLHNFPSTWRLFVVYFVLFFSSFVPLLYRAPLWGVEAAVNYDKNKKTSSHKWAWIEEYLKKLHTRESFQYFQGGKKLFSTPLSLFLPPTLWQNTLQKSKYLQHIYVYKEQLDVY
jgi:hypothetical protein